MKTFEVFARGRDMAIQVRADSWVWDGGQLHFFRDSDQKQSVSGFLITEIVGFVEEISE